MKKTAYLGMFLAISLILSYVESILPVTAPIPGIKLGLANCAILVLLYLYGPWEAILVNVARVTLSAFIFASVFLIRSDIKLSDYVSFVSKEEDFFTGRNRNVGRSFSQYRADYNGICRNTCKRFDLLSAFFARIRTRNRIYHRFPDQIVIALFKEDDSCKERQSE